MFNWYVERSLIEKKYIKTTISFFKYYLALTIILVY